MTLRPKGSLLRFATSTLAIAMVVAFQPVPAVAQFDMGSGSTSKPWDSLLGKSSTKKIPLNFQNTSIDRILSSFEKISGITIVRDSALVGNFNLTAAKPVTLSEAFTILSTTLSFKGYEIGSQDKMLIVRKKETRNAGRGSGGMGGPGGTPGGGVFRMGGGPGGGFSGGGEESSVIRVYSIKYANASQLAQTLNDVFQQAAANGGLPTFGGPGGTMPGGAGPGGGGPGGGGPGGGGPGGGGPGGGGPGGGRPGGGAGGQTISDGRAQQIVAPIQGGGGPQIVVPQGGPGGFQGGPGGGTFPFNLSQQSGGTSYRASADDFSNSIVVNAPERVQSQVKSLIDQLDRPTEQPLSTKIYRLQYAGAEDLQSVVQTVLNTNVPRGKGGATTQQTQGMAGFARAASGTVAGAGQVTADTRSNALIVSATADNIKVIDGIIGSLDQKVETQGSVFVFPLKNARSDSIASLLQQAFGNKQGSGSTTNTNRQTTGSTGNTNGNNNNNNNRGNQGGFGGPGASIPVDLQDPMADQGQLLTQIGVTQSFGPQMFGGQSGNSSTSRTGQGATSRDANGRVVNTSDLTNQVTTISDPNTNSIIVVASPENAEVIRRILDQIDRIPEQVLIETTIVEASLDASNKLGVEWQLTSGLGKGLDNATGTGGTNFGLESANSQGLQYALTSANFTAFLNALKSDQKFQVLSRPKIFTSNNVQAEINISQSVPYIVSSQQDANGNFTYNYSFEDVGIVLTVTPHITKDGYVTLDVTQTANDLQGYTSFNAPIINQRSAETTVSVKDGNTIVLGGIIRKTVSSTVSKVPLLGDLPLLGNLFKSSSKTDTKTELLVFLSPRIVRTPEDAKKLKDETGKKDLPR